MISTPSPENVAELLINMAVDKPEHFALGYQIGSAAMAEANSDEARYPLNVVNSYVDRIKTIDPDVMNIHSTDGFIFGVMSAALTTRK